MIKRYLCLFFGLMLAGCAGVTNIGDSNFSCPLDENGVAQCMKPSEVYDKVLKNEPLNENEKRGKSKMIGNAGYSIKNIDTVGGLPIRTKKQVYRMWVAPYVDDRDRLNYSSYVFIDMGKKEWIFEKPATEEDNFEKQIFTPVNKDSNKNSKGINSFYDKEQTSDNKQQGLPVGIP